MRHRPLVQYHMVTLLACILVVALLCWIKTLPGALATPSSSRTAEISAPDSLDPSDTASAAILPQSTSVKLVWPPRREPSHVVDPTFVRPAWGVLTLVVGAFFYLWTKDGLTLSLPW